MAMRGRNLLPHRRGFIMTSRGLFDCCGLSAAPNAIKEQHGVARGHFRPKVILGAEAGEISVGRQQMSDFPSARGRREASQDCLEESGLLSAKRSVVRPGSWGRAHSPLSSVRPHHPGSSELKRYPQCPF